MFRKVGERVFPFRRETSLDGVPHRVWELQRVEILPTVDAALFVAPPDN